MNFIKAKTYDTANGPGVRVTLFCAGCPHVPKCTGCFNPETYDFYSGQPFTEDEMNKLLEKVAKPYIRGVTMLGGEPMDIRNQEGFLPFIKKVKEIPNKDIWCFTGFLWEDILKMYDSNNITKELLPLIDVMVDGKFIEELHNPRLIFRGSSNQRQIIVPETLEKGKIVTWEHTK